MSVALNDFLYYYVRIGHKVRLKNEDRLDSGELIRFKGQVETIEGIGIYDGQICIQVSDRAIGTDSLYPCELQEKFDFVEPLSREHARMILMSNNIE